MSKNKNEPMEHIKNIKQENWLRILSRIFVSMFIILIVANEVDAILDCSMCHKTAPGGAAIRAADTIEINNRTCLRCHNPDYPPEPIGYDTHLAHIGKYSAKVDYLSRHPKTVESFSCDNCHMNIGEKCQNCHIRNIPHIDPPLGYSCKGCHGVLDKLFQHPTINLKVHNIFGANGTKACAMCHNSDNMVLLRLASDETVSMQDAYRLCFQCHSGYYNLWNSGQHYSNYTVPSDAELSFDNGMGRGMGSDIPAIKAGLENKWKKENTCQNCHNPHNPRELYQSPVVGSRKTADTSTMDIILYVGLVLIAIVVAITIFVIKKKGLTLSDIKRLRLSDLKNVKLPKVTLSDMKNVKLPKLKLPKISIPISVSIEKIDNESNKDINKSNKDINESNKDINESNKDINESNKDINENNKDINESNKDINKPHVLDTMLVNRSDDHKDSEKLTEETVSKHEKKIVSKKSFVYRYKKDIIFVLAICIMLGAFYAIFGAFMPMTVVVSESMSPHIEKGDIIFYMSIDRVERIETNDKKNSINFEDYGDVIIYRPLGRNDAVPYIHRAMYYVNQGNEMWPGSTNAPSAGYITKGDNTETNRQYDQQSSISKGTPIKREWIVGIAKFRIPYIGYIRLMLS